MIPGLLVYRRDFGLRQDDVFILLAQHMILQRQLGFHWDAFATSPLTGGAFQFCEVIDVACTD